MEDLEKIQPLKFQHPGNIVFYGKTFSGKTTFLVNLLSNANKLFKTEDEKEIKKTVYRYKSVWQPRFDTLERN